ncbi:unnamed protein product [Microthlaspi erraticum]|uniref:Uncharacterized protein n=1 Tax=Microthlaspi erraticum TaxID=1685480 RepID=A0A6D2K889_9BRAS|nr:unnamed protein product [Microthlaspi erraticum]
MPREPGNKASRPRNPTRVPWPMRPSEPGKNIPRPSEKPSAKSSGHDRSDSAHDPTKRSYNQKSEDCPDGSIENQRPTAQSGWPRNERSTLGQISSVRLKSRPKSKTVGRSQSRPGKLLPAVGHATTLRHAAHDQRASREQASRPRNCLAYHARRSVRAGELARVRPRDFIGQIFIRPTTAADHASVRPRPFRSRRHDPISGRSSRPTVPTPRSTQARFEARFHIFKPGLTLSRLKRPSTIYIAF